MIANYTLLIYLALEIALLQEIPLNIIIDTYNIVLKLSIGPTLEQRKRTNVFRQTDFTNVQTRSSWQRSLTANKIRSRNHVI